MPTLVDAKYAALTTQGYTGGLSDMTLAWLQANGASTQNTASDALELAMARRGFLGRDAWNNFLLAEGYSGSVSDMALSFWVAGGNLPAIP